MLARLPALALVLLTNGTAIAADPDKVRLDAAKKTYELVLASFRQGTEKLEVETVYRWSHRWLNAQRALAKGSADKVAALKAHLDRMKGLAKVVRDQWRVGTRLPWEVAAVRYFVAEAEGWLARAQAK